jgi:serine/threonine protein phosphatase 1
LRQIVIGDIHGCVNTLGELLFQKVKVTNEDEVYFLGDYVNKGPDSKGVIDLILNLQNLNYQLTCLRGNHEQYLLDSLRYSWEEVAFKARGGDATLSSFGVENVHDIPGRYIDFMSGLSFFVELADHLLIHAGLNFDLEDPFKDDYAMLNTKRMEVEPDKIGGKVIIHGHVPTPLNQIKRAFAAGNLTHFSIDGGCVYNHQPGYSYLVAYDLTNNKVYEQKNLDGFSIRNL